jgi:hypothetical protein
MATQKGTRAAGLTQWSERDELQMDLAHTPLSRGTRGNWKRSEKILPLLRMPPFQHDEALLPMYLTTDCHFSLGART